MSHDALSTVLRDEPLLEFTDKFLSDHPDAELFLVGGAVRDIILIRPVKDFDFVVRNVSADKIESWFASRGEIDLVGRDFGVYKFLPNGFSARTHKFIDISLPRTERATENNLGGYREFEIQASETLPIEDDLSRRDFTINAMAYDVRHDKLIDPFGGQQDLDQRLIRAVGNPNERFKEDLSRVLRAIRFSAELVFDIEKETLKAITESAKKLNSKRKDEYDQDIFVVPRETIAKELSKALSIDPKSTVTLLQKTGALSILIPDLNEILEKDAENYLSPIMLGGLRNITTILALLLRGVEAKRAKALTKELGFQTLPKDGFLHVEPEDVKWMVQQLKDEPALQKTVDAPGSKFETLYMNGRARHFIPFLLALGKDDIVAKAEERKNRILELWNVKHHKHIPRLISGDDVLAQGVEAGPKVRTILSQIRDEQLDGKVMRREQALSRLKELANA